MFALSRDRRSAVVPSIPAATPPSRPPPIDPRSGEAAPRACDDFP